MQFAKFVRAREIFFVGQMSPLIHRTNEYVNMRSGFIHVQHGFRQLARTLVPESLQTAFRPDPYIFQINLIELLIVE